MNVDPASAVLEPAKGESTHVELNSLQRIVARRMTQSRAEVPDFSLRMRVSMDAVIELRAALASAADAGRAVPTLNDVFVAASARALAEHPHANGSYRDGRFELHGRVNVGVAVAAPGALLVPTVFDADRKSLADIASTTRELARRAREGRLRPGDLSGGTFTVSNLGMFGVESFVPIVNAPQAAILGVGEVTVGPCSEHGKLVWRHSATLTLSCDHRILYGADAARFLARVRELVERPSLVNGNASPQPPQRAGRGGRREE